MALFLFTKGILAGRPIPVFNQGNMVRDFTYVDDIVQGIVSVLDRPAKPNREWRGEAPDPATSQAPYRVYNIGNNRPVKLLRYIELLEQSLGKKAVLDLQPMQKGDVPATMADVSALEEDVGYRPATSVEVGIPRFVEWYRSYYKV
jgi:UDP-glucuronate 4-epimerase